MTALAVAVYVVYLVSAFVVRTALHLRRTGDSGFRGLSGRPGSAAWWAGVLFVLALVVGLAAPVAGWWGLDPIGPVDRPAVNLGGLALAVTGVVLTLVAQLHMGSTWRIGVDEDERTELVTTGLFGIVRNPFFAATGVTALGLALMVPNVLALTGLVALVVALQLQVRVVEEPYLRAAHGEAYAHYRSRTGRFLPFLGRASGRAESPPSAAGTVRPRGGRA